MRRCLRPFAAWEGEHVEPPRAAGARGRHSIRHRVRVAARLHAMLGATALIFAHVPGVANGQTRYEIQASVSQGAPQIRGSMRAVFTNNSSLALPDIYLLLFPNRFASAANDAGAVNDVTRPFVYPHESFVAGKMTLADLTVVDENGGPLLDRAVETSHQSLPAGCLLRLWLRRPLAPGKTARLHVSFTTTLPERFGPFGGFGGMLTALGGWHPYFPGLGTDGRWLLDRYPPAAAFHVDLTAPAGLELLLNGRHQTRRGAALTASLDNVHFLSLVAAPRFERVEAVGGARQVVLYRLPARFSARIGAGPDADSVLVDTLRDLSATLEPSSQDESTTVVVVEVPLRLALSHPAEGMIAISDRAFHVHPLLRPFHRKQLAAAMAYELIRPAVSTREGTADYHWVAEGLATAAADADRERHHPKARSVYDWIDLFNIFAIVDRFESEPKIPFVTAFFPKVREEDPVHQGVLSFNNRLPPGSLVFTKLRAVLGNENLGNLVRGYPERQDTFRAQAERIFGDDLEWFFDSWIKPYPELDYLVESARLNQPEEGGFRHSVSVARESSHPVREPVEVEFRGRRGATADVVWNEGASRGNVEVRTPERVRRVAIDPNRRLLEDTRVNNQWPPSLQVVIDSADVTITSTQFGAAALGVARRRYDYRKDLALLGFFNERGLGMNTGARYHWGPRVDATSYRHNLFGYYTYVSLDRAFENEAQPGIRTGGSMAGFGMRYDYRTVFGYDNPTEKRDLRLFVDWYDDRLGGEYRFINWGAVLTATHPLGSPRTVLAAQLLNGFTDSVDGSLVPNQGLYSLGGDLSIRGISVEEKLGENILLLRTEIRRIMYPEMDINFFDWFTFRRGQLRLFVDTGQVDNRRGTLYRPGHFAVGVGIGLAAVYDFMGFFPGIAYIEVAQRVDSFDGVDSGPQVLLGTRQPF